MLVKNTNFEIFRTSAFSLGPFFIIIRSAHWTESEILMTKNVCPLPELAQRNRIGCSCHFHRNTNYG